MSHIRIKTTYQEEGPYGTEETRTLYCHHNLSCDYVTFYDDRADVIMCVPDTIKNNLLDAINKLYTGSGEVGKDGIEYMTPEEREKIFK